MVGHSTACLPSASSWDDTRAHSFLFNAVLVEPADKHNSFAHLFLIAFADDRFLAFLMQASEADLKSLESQIKSLKGRVARGDGELASIKGVISYLQTELIRKADRDDVTKLKISGLLSPRGRRISPRGGPAEAGGEAAEKAAGAEGEAGGDSTLEEATLEEADRCPSCINPHLHAHFNPWASYVLRPTALLSNQVQNAHVI